MFSLGSWLPALPGLAWGWALLDALLQGETPPPLSSSRVAWGRLGDMLGWGATTPVTRCCLFPAGLVGACAVSVLCSLLKVYLYIQCSK